MIKKLQTSIFRTSSQFLIKFITGIIIARLLPPSEVGIFVIALSTITILDAVKQFGVPRFILKERILTNEILGSVNLVALLFAVLMGVALFAFSKSIAQFYSEPQPEEIFRVLAIGAFFSFIGVVRIALLRRDQQHFILAKITLFSELANSFVSIFLVLQGIGAIALAYGALCHTLCVAVLSFRATKRSYQFSIAVINVSRVFRFGGYAVLVAFVGQLEAQFSTIAIGRFFTTGDVALYSRAQTFSRLFVSLLTSSTTWVTGPRMAEIIRSDLLIDTILIKSTERLCLLCWPGLIVLGANGEVVITLLYGENWRQAGTLLPPLCAAVAVILIRSQTVAVFEATGAIKRNLASVITSLIVTIGLFMIGLEFGLIGVAWSRVPAACFSVILSFLLIEKYSGVSVTTVFLALKNAVFLSFLIGAFVFSSNLVFLTFHIHEVTALCVHVIGTVIIFSVYVFVMQHPIVNECKDIIHHLRFKVK